MRSPTAAILWEIWARNRWPLVFVIVLLLAAACLTAIAKWLQPLQTFAGESPTLWVFVAIFCVLGVLLSLACLFWSFSFTSLDERGRFAGFPLRLFTLPMRTRHVVAVPLFTGLATVVCAYLAWYFFITEILIGPRLPASETFPGLIEVSWHVLVIATGYVTMQTLIWLLYPTRHLRIVVLSIVPVGFWVLWLWVPDAHFHQHPGRWFAAVGTLFAVSVVSAFKVVEWDRRGGWQGTLRWIFAGKHREAFVKFSSPARAQFWFEWRRKGWFAAILMGTAMGLSLFLWPVPQFLEGELQFAAAGYPPRPFELMVFWSFPMLALTLTTAIASGFGKADLWSPELALPSFHATRPVTSATLIIGKMKAAAVCIGIVWCVLLLFVGWIIFDSWWRPGTNQFWITFRHAHPALWKWLTNPFVFVTLAAVHWHAFINAMTITLAGTKRHVVAQNWRIILTTSAVLGVVTWCYKHPWDIEFWIIFLPGIALALVLWKMFCAWIAFKRARPLLSSGQRRAMMGIWLVLCVAIALSGFFAQRLNAMPAEIVWFFAAWFMPSGGMADSVAKFSANRHR